MTVLGGAVDHEVHHGMGGFHRTTVVLHADQVHAVVRRCERACGCVVMAAVVVDHVIELVRPGCRCDDVEGSESSQERQMTLTLLIWKSVKTF